RQRQGNVCFGQTMLEGKRRRKERREEGNNGQEMGRTGSKEYLKRQITKDFRKKAKHFQTNKRGYENAF
uniref:hypothetical protein n=1 Tax=uncultured Bacteroides sp. TaxID=162156 RepID=UPI0025D81041